MKIRFTPSGRTQFLQAISYILQDNPRAALQFRKKCERALRRLTRHPESGRLIPEFPDLPFREVIVPPYRFFYRCEDRTIWVVAWGTTAHGTEEDPARASHQDPRPIKKQPHGLLRQAAFSS